MKPKDIFKELCYCDKKSVYIRYLQIKYRKNIQFQADLNFVIHNTLTKNKCRYCDKTVNIEDFDYVAGYWFPNMWFIVHKDCKKQSLIEEAYLCQCIDEACNDCKNFTREDRTSKHIYNGHCNKFNKKVITSSNTCEINFCFEHRKENLNENNSN